MFPSYCTMMGVCGISTNCHDIVNNFRILVLLMTTGMFLFGHYHYPSFSHPWRTIVFATRKTLQVPHLEQELFALHGHLLIFSEVRVAQSLVFCVVLCILLFVLFSFSFGNRIICPSIYSFSLPFWYLQTFCWRKVKSYRLYKWHSW